MNRLDIARAIVARFAPGAMTPPTGEADVQMATERLPANITTTPCVLVFPPTESFTHSASARQSVQEWRVVFYLAQRGETGVEVVRAYGWADVLADRLIGNVQLGEGADGVTHAVVSGMRAGLVTYADEEYAAVELAVEVHTAEGKTFTA